MSVQIFMKNSWVSLKYQTTFARARPLKKILRTQSSILQLIFPLLHLVPPIQPLVHAFKSWNSPRILRQTLRMSLTASTSDPIQRLSSWPDIHLRAGMIHHGKIRSFLPRRAPRLVNTLCVSERHSAGTAAASPQTSQTTTRTWTRWTTGWYVTEPKQS